MKVDDTAGPTLVYRAAGQVVTNTGLLSAFCFALLSGATTAVESA